MKFTDEEIQSAIDKTFPKLSLESALIVSARLEMVKRFLAELMAKKIPEVRAAEERAEKAEAELARQKEIADSEFQRATYYEKQATEAAGNQLSQLRPIAEAGTVPEGCVRVFFYQSEGRWMTDYCESCDVTHFADIRLQALAEKPEHETFEAHGKTWTRHKPEDAMPCDGEKLVTCLFADGDEWKTKIPAREVRWSKDDSAGDIIGWRYADEPTPELLETDLATANANPVEDLALGGQMYWRDLARQLAATISRRTRRFW